MSQLGPDPNWLTRAVEEILARDPARYAITIFGVSGTNPITRKPR